LKAIADHAIARLTFATDAAQLHHGLAGTV